MELVEAITKAREFIKEALPDVQSVSTDEIEYDEAKEAWRITFGYKRELPPRKLASGGSVGALVDALRPSNILEYEDVYRIIIVPENAGKISMKIR